MKKDYIPVTPGDLDAPEILAVENQWTSVWQKNKEQLGVRVAGIPQREEYRLMTPYLKQIRPGGRIVDAGCGLGEWTVYLEGLGYETHGVDISRQTIAFLAEQSPRSRFLCSDFRQLDFPDNFFDACLAWGSFEHFEEGLGRCLAEASRVLTPGGYLFITVPFHNWRHLLLDAVSPPRRETRQPTGGNTSLSLRFYQWRLTKAELELELALRGFRTVQIHPIHRQEGLGRALVHELRLPAGSLLQRGAARLLYRFLPGIWIAHMIMAVAQKVEI